MTQSAITSALNGKAASSHTHSYLPLTGGTVTGQTIFTNDNPIRFVYGSTYGFIMRHDGNNIYFMPTLQNNPYGSWDADKFSYMRLADGRFSFRNDSNDSTCANGFPVITTMGTLQVSSIQGTSTSLSIASRSGGDTFSNHTIKYTSSDIRLKKNIKETSITDALGILNRIKLHQYDWKDPELGHQDIGFIADELETIDPLLVFGGGYIDEEHTQMNIKGVETFYLIGYIVKAIQELSNKLN